MLFIRYYTNSFQQYVNQGLWLNQIEEINYVYLDW